MRLRLHMLFIFSALPVIAFFAMAFVLALRIFSGDPSRLPSALIGKSVPDFTLVSLEGLTIPALASSDLRQGKNSLVNIWASWCVPCREEHRLLLELAYESARENFQLVGINYKDQPEAARRFLETYQNPYARIGADMSGRVAIDWGVYGVPETFVVNGQGRILFKQVGPLTRDVIGEKIMPLLRGKPS